MSISNHSVQLSDYGARGVQYTGLFFKIINDIVYRIHAVLSHYLVKHERLIPSVKVCVLGKYSQNRRFKSPNKIYVGL